MEIYKTDQKIEAPDMIGTKISIQYPAVAEIKIDGEFNLLFVNKEREGEVHTFLVNKGGKIRTECGITAEAKTLPTSMVLVGELYYEDGKQGALYKLLSHQEDNGLKFMVHDIIEYEDAIMNTESLLDRKELLLTIFKDSSPHIAVSKINMVESSEELDEFYDTVIKEGYEGIVVKGIDSRYIGRRCNWVKIKAKDIGEYKITAIDPTEEKIIIQAGIKVGVKCINSVKCQLKVGDKVLIESLGSLESGSLRNPVLKGKITGDSTQMFL